MPPPVEKIYIAQIRKRINMFLKYKKYKKGEQK